MNGDLHFVRDYPFPPEDVWRALTVPELIEAWLMPNDFVAEVGHEFTMKTDPAPGFDGIVRAKVLALEPPARMVWSWKGGGHHTVVTFRLEPRIVLARSGTRLRLDHEGFEGLPGVLVSAILGAGWRRILRGRLRAAIEQVAERGTIDGLTEACEKRRGAWYWLAKLFAPVLRREDGRQP